MRHPILFAGLVSLLAGAGCAKTTNQLQALLDVKAFIDHNLEDLSAASVALRDHAPAPDADGWSATTDAAAVAQLKADWKKARTAYEQIEGAIAVLFPELDAAIDARYDDFISDRADPNLFDGDGVTGVHAVERILWSDVMPERVRTFEMALPNYQAAAFPANAQEAGDFKNKLCVRLVDDVESMRAQFRPLALDVAAAYRGVIASMDEQVEKTNKAATGEEESRYAQYTLADMRSNVAAGVQTFEAFRPWLSEVGGAALDAQIGAGFQKIQAAYDAISGDSLPPVPATWSMSPSAADLATPFGMLYELVAFETDPKEPGSLVRSMNDSADLLGIAKLPE